MPTDPLRVLLVDDHTVVRAGYRRLLEHHGAFQVVGEAGDGHEAYDRFKALAPDVAVIDVMMPGSSGIEAIRRIIAYDRDARLLVFTMYTRAAIAHQALSAGATGVLGKDCAPAEMIEAVRAVARGERYLSQAIASSLVDAGLERPLESRFARLSPREFEVCHMLLRGHRIEDIAESLSISSKTVSNLLSIVRQKVGVTTDIALFGEAARAGLLDWLLAERPDVGPASGSGPDASGT